MMIKSLFILLALVTIQNKQVTLSVDQNSGKLMEYTVNGKNYVQEGGCTATPWAFTALGPNGERPSLSPARAQYAYARLDPENIDRIIIEWRLTFEYQASFSLFTYIFMPRTGFPLWDIEITMPQGWKISNLVFPDVIFKAKENSKVFTPSFWGESRVMNYNSVYCRYPSMFCTMNFAMAEAEGGSFFISSQDNSGCEKIYTVTRAGDKTRLTQTTPTSLGWTSEDGVYKSPWSTEIAIYPGDWQTLLKNYYLPRFEKAGFLKKGRKTAEWLKNCDLWYVCDGTSKSVEAVERAAVKCGTGGVLLSSTDARVVEALKKSGCRVIVDLNCTHWNSSEADFAQAGGRKAMAKQMNGTFYSDYRPNGNFWNLACPASAEWKEKIKKSWLVAIESGADGINAGDIIAQRPETCYDKDHSHPLGGGDWWSKECRAFISENRQILTNSGKVLCCNEFNEQSMDLFDLCFVRKATRATGFVQTPVIPQLFSGNLLYAGFTSAPASYTDGCFRYELAKSLLWGSQLLIFNPSKILGSETEFVTALVKFRSESHDVFVGGRFLEEFIPSGDNPVHNLPSYGSCHLVLGARWKNAKGKPVTILVNMDTQSHSVSVDGVVRTVEPLCAIKL